MLPDHPAIVYFARWTPECPGSLIAILIGLGHPDGFVSVLYRFDSNSLMVVGPDDYDWQIFRRHPATGPGHRHAACQDGVPNAGRNLAPRSRADRVRPVGGETRLSRLERD
jgi:hypothetical protein